MIHNQKKYNISSWIKRLQNIKVQKLSPISIFSIIMLVIFIAELFVMIVLLRLHISSIWIESLIDSLFLLILLSPVLYFFFLKPLTIKVTELIDINEISHSLAIFSQLNPAPVFRFDLDGKILLSNPAANDLSKHEKLDEQIINDFLSLSKIDIKSFIHKGKSIVLEETINKRDFQFTIVGVPELEVGHIYGSEITDIKRTEKLQNALYKISETAQLSKSENELFKSIHNIVNELMPAKNFYIAYYNKDTDIISFPYFMDENDVQPEPRQRRKGLTEYVLKNGIPLLVSTKEIESLVNKGKIKIFGSLPIEWLGVPLKAKKKVIGIIAIQNYAQEIRLTKKHKELLMYVSAQIALAIQRYRAESELLESETKFRSVAQSATEAIISADSDGNIIFWNDSAEKIFGFKEEEILEKSLTTIIPEKYKDAHNRGIQRVKSENRAPLLGKTIELEGLKKNGERFPIELSLSTWNFGEKSYYTGIIRDITSRVETQKALEDKIRNLVDAKIAAFNMMEDANMAKELAEKAEEELKESNIALTHVNTVAQETLLKLEETRDELQITLIAAKESDKLKSEFLANTSHELRTPLNSIIGFLNLIKDDLYDSPKEEKEFIINALKSSHHLLELINDVLDIAKIEAGKMEVDLTTINLKDIFDEILLLTLVQAKQKKLKLDFIVKNNKEIIILADYQKLKQVLLNLIDNSLKFTSYGSINVSAKQIKNNSKVQILIEDTGIGIPLEKQKIVFDKFTQVDGSTSRQYSGTGLGLSITKSLIELMDGTIDLTSAGSGKGTKVSLTLPLKHSYEK